MPLSLVRVDDLGFIGMILTTHGPNAAIVAAGEVRPAVSPRVIQVRCCKFQSRERDPIMSKGHSLNISLELKPEHHDVLATVSVVLLDTCYHAGALTEGAPSGIPIIAGDTYLTFAVTHTTGEECGQVVTTAKKSIKLHSSILTHTCTAYVTVNGEVAGHVTEPFPKHT